MILFEINKKKFEFFGKKSLPDLPEVPQAPGH